MGLFTVGLKQEDRDRFDKLLNVLHDFKQILHNLRHNDDVVIRISLDHRTNRKDDIRKRT